MTNQKRIAICISGQVRTSTEKLKEISDLAHEIEADVFISVWEARGGKTLDAGTPHVTFERIIGGELASFFPKAWVTRPKSILPPWRDILPSYERVTVSELHEIFPEASVEIEADRPDLDLPSEKNSLRMLYKIHRCNLLKRKRETSEGFKYDLVIRHRPDILLKYQDFVNYNSSPNDLLIFLMRGDNHLAHDKYWAGSSAVDDIMANFFDEARTDRIQQWEGIHKELSSYINRNNLNQVDFRSVLSDFRVFGAYSKNEKYLTIEKLIAQMELRSREDLSGFSSDFVKVALKVLRSAVELVFHRDAYAVKTEIADQLAALIEDSPYSAAYMQLLPATSLLIACDYETPYEDRAKLAYSVLLNDALTWKIWLGYRAHNAVKLLPSSGSELLYLFDKSGEVPKLKATGNVAGNLLAIWQNHFSMYHRRVISRAKADLWQAILRPPEIRTIIVNFLKDMDLNEEMLSFAKLLKQEFPGQKNAETLFAQVQRHTTDMAARSKSSDR